MNSFKLPKGKSVLGRGMDSLISQVQDNNISVDVVQKIPVDKIRTNRYQPRRVFDEAALAELSESIKLRGLIQPITVWKDNGEDFYELVAGERRWRAAKQAGLTVIDAIVKKDLKDEQKLAFALIENIQRENLNAVETALAYKQLMTQFGITQAEISRSIGKSRSAVANTLRLLELEEEIQKAIESGIITEGHARALMMIPDKDKRKQIYYRIIAEKLSVRDVEKIAQGMNLENQSSKIRRKRSSFITPEITAIQDNLSRHLGTKIEISPAAGENNGKIVIHYFNYDHFQHIKELLEK